MATQMDASVRPKRARGAGWKCTGSRRLLSGAVAESWVHRTGIFCLSSVAERDGVACFHVSASVAPVLAHPSVRHASMLSRACTEAEIYHVRDAFGLGEAEETRLGSIGRDLWLAVGAGRRS